MGDRARDGRRGVSWAAAVCAVLVAACAGAGGETPGAGPSDGAASARRPVVLTSDLQADERLLACFRSEEAVRAREEIEPHAAVAPGDGRHVVAAWMVSAPRTDGAIQASFSEDGGRTWSPPATLPMNACAGGPAGMRRTSDPWVSIGVDGRVYVSAIGYVPGADVDSASALIVVTSADGGRSWSVPSVVSETRTSEFMHDNTAIAASPQVAGEAYVASTLYSGGAGPAAVSRTRDGGASWSAHRPASPVVESAHFASAPQIVIGRRPGELFVFYSHGSGTRRAVVRSGDAGRSWSEPVEIGASEGLARPLRFPGTDVPLRVAEDIIHPAIDRQTGRLYLVYVAPGSGGPGEPAVWLTWSSDAGATWQEPVRVSAPGVPGWRPTLAVAEDGEVAVTWFRRSGTAAQGGQADARDGLPTSVVLSLYRPHPERGLEEAGARVIDRFGWMPRAGGTYFLGDYHGLVATADGVLPVYSRSTREGIRVVALPYGDE